MKGYYLIRYSSRSTVNGEPVGDVYVVDIQSLSGVGSFSYTKDQDKATEFMRTYAEELIATHRWPMATMIEAKP